MQMKNNGCQKHIYIPDVSGRWHRSVNSIRLPGLLVISLWLTASGCEQTFEPLQKSDDYYFSIYGYLDASADTQWVRVIPLREGTVQLPEVSDVTVTLKHLNSGSSIELSDSLFQFYHGASSWNYWTTMDLIPDQAYLLTAAYGDGRSSSAEVMLPPDFPQPVFDEESDIVRIMDIEHLADVQTRYHVRLGQSGGDYLVSFPYKQEISPYSPTEYRVRLRPGNDQTYLNEFYPGGSILNRQIFVASAGPGWPDFDSLDEIVETLPDGVSNIENGVGYLAGIVSKIIPLRSCYDENDILVACPAE